MTDDVVWYLDVLDPLGGLAFASHRQSDKQAKRLDATPPAVFIGAPTFQPIGVRSRSVGFAAARRGFQSGLFIGGDEVGFPELEDVIEFVRRCYQNGGGGAGAGAGGGGAPPLRPEVPGPELPLLPDMKLDGDGRAADGLSAMTSLRSNFRSYKKGCAELKGPWLGMSFRANWSRPPRLQYQAGSTSSSGSRPTDGVEILVRGATRILAEMIRRLPLATENPDALINWQGAWYRLIVVIEQMGVQKYLYDNYFDYLAQLLKSVGSGTHGRSFQDRISNHWNLVEMFDGLMWCRGLGSESIDAFDDLGTWPSPTDSVQRPPSPSYQYSTSLLNQLAVFLSAPPADDGSSSVDAEIELVLFAAARLVMTSSRDIRALTLAGGHPRFWREGELVHRRAVERLAEAAWGWLIDQLPKRGFMPSLERAIASTSTLVAA